MNSWCLNKTFVTSAEQHPLSSLWDRNISHISQDSLQIIALMTSSSGNPTDKYGFHQVTVCWLPVLFCVWMEPWNCALLVSIRCRGPLCRDLLLISFSQLWNLAATQVVAMIVYKEFTAEINYRNNYRLNTHWPTTVRMMMVCTINVSIIESRNTDHFQNSFYFISTCVNLLILRLKTKRSVCLGEPGL